MKNVLTDFSYPNHCGLVKDMVYLKYIFTYRYLYYILFTHNCQPLIILSY